MGVRNIKLTIAYDGTEYHGWQIQPGFRTIQGVLAEAIGGLLGCKVRVCGASRTDAGVSALGQVGLVQIDSPIPTENLAKAITDRLPPDMAVVEAVEVPLGFDVIGAVKSKLYRYTIYTGPVRPVLHIRRCWHIATKLDIAVMDAAAKFLVGTKDFKSFAAGDDKREDTVRTIFRCDVYSSNEKRLTAENAESAEKKINHELTRTDTNKRANNELVRIRETSWQKSPLSATPAGSAVMKSERNTQDENDWIYVDVEGNSFLYNMVRNIVGTLVEVGVGRWKPEKINEILEAKDRTVAGPLAPAAGLCLVHIEY
jgi:tRNA pseudouridine38-40 synthase